MGKEIIVTNCWICPFVNDDGEYGKTYCQLNDDIVMPGSFEQMPKDKVHDNCPLKDGEVTVTLGL
jgi:hypothetical protein